MIKCDVIKPNESELTNTDLRADNFFLSYCFAALQMPVSLEPIYQFLWDLMVKDNFANDAYNQSEK